MKGCITKRLIGDLEFVRGVFGRTTSKFVAAALFKLPDSFFRPIGKAKGLISGYDRHEGWWYELCRLLMMSKRTAALALVSSRETKLGVSRGVVICGLLEGIDQPFVSRALDELLVVETTQDNYSLLKSIILNYDKIVQHQNVVNKVEKTLSICFSKTPERVGGGKEDILALLKGRSREAIIGLWGGEYLPAVKVGFGCWVDRLAKTRHLVENSREFGEKSDLILNELRGSLNTNSAKTEELRLLASLYARKEDLSQSIKTIENTFGFQPYCSSSTKLMLGVLYKNGDKSQLKKFAMERIGFYSRALSSIWVAGPKRKMLKRKYWIFIRLLATYVSKEELNSLFPEESRRVIDKISKDNGQEFYFHLYFGTIGSALGLADTLFSETPFKLLPQVKKFATKDSSTLRYFSIRHINYQFLLASQFHEFPEGDTVLCDPRFIELFQENYPHLKFRSAPLLGCEADSKAFLNESGLHKVGRVELMNFAENSDYSKSWLGTKKASRFECISKNKVNIGISIGSIDWSLHRQMHSLDYNEMLKLFDGYDVNLVNLDYWADARTLRLLNVADPQIDLKNDIYHLTALIEQLDFSVLMPNNLMDAVAATGGTAIVFDPCDGGSYWKSEVSKRYIFSERILHATRGNKGQTLECMRELIEATIRRLSCSAPS